MLLANQKPIYKTGIEGVGFVHISNANFLGTNGETVYTTSTWQATTAYNPNSNPRPIIGSMTGYYLYSIGTMQGGVYNLADYGSTTQVVYSCNKSAIAYTGNLIGTITIISPTCTFDAATQTVDLGTIAWSSTQSMANGDLLGNKQSVDLTLTCSERTTPKVSLTDRNAATSTQNYITLTQETGVAKGIAIQAFLNDGTTPLVMGTSYSLNGGATITSNGTSVPMALWFSYIKQNDVDTGAANAIVDLNFSYD